jgi:hypothetical protein
MRLRLTFCDRAGLTTSHAGPTRDAFIYNKGI